MMSAKLDRMQNLGDAFLAQQKDVMDTVQTLRQKATEAGNLKTSMNRRWLSNRRKYHRTCDSSGCLCADL